MRPRAVLLLALVAFTAFTPLPAADSAPPAAPAPAPKVKLAVLVMFDQMRGDFPERWKPLYGPSGFVRIQTEGATFTHCYYPYGVTITGPGHASVMTGTCPDRHGIVMNSWYERGRNIYCASDDRYSLVPGPGMDPKSGRGAKSPPAGTPERLLSETVGDVLRQQYGEKAKIFGMSLKDRSAIFPSGKNADGAFWFNGQFVTSTYYTDRVDRVVPEWVTAFNRSNKADAWFGKDWTRFRADLDYERYSGPDDVAAEGTGTKQGRTFPHSMTGGLKAPGKDYYTALANSPFANDLLLQFAKECITAEKLGEDDIPDLLTVSFSSNDIVGHTWGPDSQEVLDVTLRSDALIANLLEYLDMKVGKGQYVLAITADHGVCPMPEVHKDGAKRVDLTPIRAAAEKHLQATFGKGGAKKGTSWIEFFSAPWFYLNPRLIAESGKDRAEVARSLADFLAKHPDLHRVFTREDLSKPVREGDEIAKLVKRGFYPDRCGDVYLVLNPYCLPSRPGATGTTHGSPHPYDRHVPLMVFGPGVKTGTHTEPVTPQASAAIFANFLGIRPPAHADFPVPATLMK